MKTVIYCRVSKHTEKSNSFLDQENICVAYCKKNKMRIHEIHKEHKSGIGKQINLLNIVRTYKNINLVVYNTTRFTRNMIIGKNLLSTCLDRNIEVHFVREKIVFNRYTSSNLLQDLMEKFTDSEKEWNQIRERNIKNIKLRKALGLCIGNVPFGYDKLDTKELILNNDYNVIRLIVALRKGEKNIDEIHKIFKKISNEYNLLKFYDENNKEIKKFTYQYTLDFKDIADILNEFNINNKHWIPSKVKFLYDKYNNDKNIELIEDNNVNINLDSINVHNFIKKDVNYII